MSKAKFLVLVALFELVFYALMIHGEVMDRYTNGHPNRPAIIAPLPAKK